MARLDEDGQDAVVAVGRAGQLVGLAPRENTRQLGAGQLVRRRHVGYRFLIWKLLTTTERSTAVG